MTEREREAQATREQAVDELCRRLGLQRSSPSLELALVHPSFANEQPAEARGDNQRLEFLGDAVLGVCVSEQLMDRFTHIDEGELTVMRASLVNADALAEVARELGLGAALLMGRGAEAAGERHRTNVLADALEALVGAVFQDDGLDGARRLCRSMVADRIDALHARGGIERDGKSRLQERLQAQGLPPPSYRVVRAEGPPHARSFLVEVEIDRDGQAPLVAGHGTGRSKKLAEQAAASEALALLESEELEP